jgi:NDP-sugar pyrophosphorylase family protein
MNGDILTDLSFGDFYQSHVEKNCLFTISSHRREQLIDYGVLEMNNSNNLIGFIEKPRNNYEVSMGIYMVNRQVLDFIPENTPYGFDSLMHDLLKAKHEVFVQCYDGHWLDIGRPDDYMQAIEQFDSMKAKFIND